jgi:hypothetical protein
VVLAHSWWLEYLGLTLNFLEIAVLPQFEIYLVLGALLLVEGLVELALGVVFA